MPSRVASGFRFGVQLGPFVGTISSRQPVKDIAPRTLYLQPVSELGVNLSPETFILVGIALGWFVGAMGNATRAVARGGHVQDSTQ